jgi:hypothetical protein
MFVNVFNMGSMKMTVFWDFVLYNVVEIGQRIKS